MVKDRWKTAQEKQLWYRCLCAHHRGKNCKWSRSCGVDGCWRQHHRLLHGLWSDPSSAATTVTGPTVEQQLVSDEVGDRILFSFSSDKDRRTDSRIRRKNTAQPRRWSNPVVRRPKPEKVLRSEVMLPPSVNKTIDSRLDRGRAFRVELRLLARSDRGRLRERDVF